MTAGQKRDPRSYYAKKPKPYNPPIRVIKATGVFKKKAKKK